MSSSRTSRRLKALSSQITSINQRLSVLSSRERRLSQWRLVSFALVFIVGSAVLVTLGAIPWAATSVILLIPFVIFVRLHRQVERSFQQFQALLQLKQDQKARMLLEWNQIPYDSTVKVIADHPFATDLNLIGRRSLHHLIDISVTREGSQRLCNWLTNTEPDPVISHKRREIVEPLMRMTSLRDRLIVNSKLAGDMGGKFTSGAVTGGDNDQRLKQQYDYGGLLAWLKTPTDLPALRRALFILGVLAPLNIGLLAASILFGWPPIWVASWLLYGFITLSNVQKIGPLFQDAAYLKDRLHQISSIFALLENRSFSSYPSLEELLKPIKEQGKRPSHQLRRINRLLSAAGLGINPFIAFLLNAIVPWDVFLGYSLGNLKKEIYHLAEGWLDVWTDLEAYWGLANIGVIYPEAVFADIQSGFGKSDQMNINQHRPFEAEQIGHPLIPSEKRIANDFSIEKLGEVLIVSGSNMSGKSTFLRTVGINICLAQAGAPVLARQLRMVPFRIAASIRIVDSLADGFSFFYAEVRRLKIILDELKKPHPYPLFYFIDEIFRGTNNKERFIGSRAFVQALTGCYGVGAIATHDLALVQLAESSQKISNYHFKDDVVNGQMVFDYHIYDGPCPTTNALRIMQLAGLPVETADLDENGKEDHSKSI